MHLDDKEEVKDDSLLDEQWEDFSSLEEETEMIRQIAEAENDHMRRYEKDQLKRGKETPKTIYLGGGPTEETTRSQTPGKLQPAGRSRKENPKPQQNKSKPSRLLPPQLHQVRRRSP